jgi:hypothetical protein
MALMVLSLSWQWLDLTRERLMRLSASLRWY